MMRIHVLSEFSLLEQLGETRISSGQRSPLDGKPYPEFRKKEA